MMMTNRADHAFVNHKIFGSPMLVSTALIKPSFANIERKIME